MSSAHSYTSEFSILFPICRYNVGCSGIENRRSYSLEYKIR